MLVDYKNITNEKLFERVSRNDDHLAFEQLYNRLAEQLYLFVVKRIQDELACEEIIQEIFISLWQNRKTSQPETLDSYLFGAARNKALSFLRSSKVRVDYAINFAFYLTQNHDNSTQDLVEVNDLKAILDSEISKLPKQCETAFRYSRFENLSNREIADKMGISIRTIENYITLALKHLRTRLKDSDFFFYLIFFREEKQS